MSATTESVSTTITQPAPSPLRDSVDYAVQKYFEHLDGQPTTDLYQMVIQEVEEPLLKAVLAHTQNNQSKSAQILGMSRGTLRKKLEQFGLL